MIEEIIVLHVNFKQESGSMFYEVDPIFEFKTELFQIKDQFYLGIVAEALAKVPDYIWFVPASSSGKYHPKSSLGMGGLVRHIKSVFWISEELLSHPLYAPFTDAEKDEIRVAILLHDMCKQGTQNTPLHTLTEHPLLVREALNPFTDLGYTADLEGTALKEKNESAWSRICDLIETHMGIWTKDHKTNQEVLDVPKTKAQLFVHMCDYLASRKIIEVDVTSRDAQNKDYGKKTNEEPAWRKEPAKLAQIDYLKKLMIMCLERNIDCPVKKINVSEYTKGTASDDIGKLKTLLGIA